MEQDGSIAQHLLTIMLRHGNHMMELAECSALVVRHLFGFDLIGEALDWI